jgi:hypothetical protein
MSKQGHAGALPLALAALALLISSLWLASCEAGVASSVQTEPTAVGTAAPNTLVQDRPAPEAEATGMAGPSPAGGFDCAGVSQIPATECAALVALYQDTNGPEWADNGGWLASDAPCTWSGIECTGDHVSDIHLSYNELTGTLPPELGSLSRLRVLGLCANRLVGLIPAELGNLLELVSLDLGGNQLTGPLPAELGNLGNLQTLSLARNQLGGPIPPGLGRLARLQSLDLSHNQFSGAIPPELGDLANLYRLDLSRNQLSGTIPAALGDLTKLDELDLGYNQLRGAVPESLTQISQRSLWGNQLDGTVPGSGEAPIAVDYRGVQFSADPSLARSVWPEVMPAAAAVEGGPIWYAAPEHLRFTFANPHLMPGRSRMGISLAAEAQILVYPLAELAGLNPMVQEQIERVQSLLAEQEPLPEGDLPLLPLANAVQVFHAQAQYLDFGTIRGLRFVTQLTQEDCPVVNNGDLFYTFQGVTDDNAWYVAAFFPVTTAVLPDDDEVEDREAFVIGFATYLSETTAVLDHLVPAEFTPDLATLDAVVTSLRVKPDSGLGSSVPSLPLASPAMGLLPRSTAS